MNIISYIKSDLARITSPTLFGFLKTYIMPRGGGVQIYSMVQNHASRKEK